MTGWGRELRRRPNVVISWAAITASFVVILVVGCWNAWHYPITLGYDYRDNVDYMHVLLDQHRLPNIDETAEYNQPPVYYVVGGIAARAGHWLFGWHEEPTHDLPEHSYRGAQLLNLGFVLGTALLLLLLARVVAPRSPPVWAAALVFFAFVPVVAKTEAMVHPEPMNMFLSTLAVWLATRLVRSARVSAPLLAGIVIVLAVGLATRASIVFTAAAITIGLAVRYVPRFALRRHLLPLGIFVAVIGLGIVAIRSTGHAGSLASLEHPTTQVSGSREPYFHPHLKAIFETPYRTYFVNSAFPTTYVELWGDWIGSFVWSTFQGSPTGEKLTVLRDQSWIGVIPTLMAVVGCALLLWLAFRSRRDLVAVALVPSIALTGYLVRSYDLISPDGDLLKASYLLTTAPIWALGFGLVWSRLGRFRLLQLGVTCALLIFAVMELRFMMYGLRDGNPVF